MLIFFLNLYYSILITKNHIWFRKIEQCMASLTVNIYRGIKNIHEQWRWHFDKIAGWTLYIWPTKYFFYFFKYKQKAGIIKQGKKLAQRHFTAITTMIFLSGLKPDCASLLLWPIQALAAGHGYIFFLNFHHCELVAGFVLAFCLCRCLQIVLRA